MVQVDLCTPGQEVRVFISPNKLRQVCLFICFSPGLWRKWPPVIPQKNMPDDGVCVALHINQLDGRGRKKDSVAPCTVTPRDHMWLNESIRKRDQGDTIMLSPDHSAPGRGAINKPTHETLVCPRTVSGRFLYASFKPDTPRFFYGCSAFAPAWSLDGPSSPKPLPRLAAPPRPDEIQPFSGRPTTAPWQPQMQEVGNLPAHTSLRQLVCPKRPVPLAADTLPRHGRRLPSFRANAAYGYAVVPISRRSLGEVRLYGHATSETLRPSTSMPAIRAPRAPHVPSARADTPGARSESTLIKIYDPR